MAKMLLGRICRTCLEKSAEMHKLREFIEDDLQIEDMLNQAIPDFDLELEDTPLPVEICEDCLEKLRVSYNFHKKCMETNQQLRDMLVRNEDEDEMPAELNDILQEDDILMDNLKKEPIDDASNGSNNFTHAPMTEFADVLSPSFQIDPVKLEIAMDDEKIGLDSDDGNSSDDYWPNDDKEDSESNLFETADIKPKRKYRKKAITKMCTECNKSYTNNLHFTRHMSVHSMENEFVCNICQYRYINDTELKKHIKRKHVVSKTITIADGPHPCPDCPMIFEQKKSLVKHKVMHMERDFKCKVCGVNCKVMAALTRHMNSKHPDVLPYKCHKCDKAFPVESHLNDHINEHLGQKKHKCEMCEKSFSSPGFLESHIRMHTGETPFLCFHCGAGFKAGNVLRQHLQIHGEKKVQCPQCPKKFYSQSVLTKHMKSHAPVKRHVCDVCGASFTRKSTLNDHKFKHTGLRPFTCEECNLSFVFKRHFKKHKLVHTGEKPHQCTYCDRAYASSGDLVKHLRIHVGEKTYFCDECPEAFKYLNGLNEHKNQHYRENMALQQNKEIDVVKPQKSDNNVK